MPRVRPAPEAAVAAHCGLDLVPVQIFRRHSRRLAWLALLAMVLSVLMPALARAGADGGWVSVCTPQGVRLVALGADAPGDPASPAGALHDPSDHCPYCSLASHGALPAPDATVAAWATTTAERPPERRHGAPRKPRGWCVAHPRAPPAGS